MDTLIRGGTLIDAELSVRGDLLIRGGVIAAVGETVEAPNGVQIIDAGGQYVMPGGIDPHTHMELPLMEAFRTWRGWACRLRLPCRHHLVGRIGAPGEGRAGRCQALTAVLMLCCAPTWAAILVVNTSADTVTADGSLSLREAMLSVAAHDDINADVTAARTGNYSNADEIRFAIASGPQTILPASALPALAAGATLDARTQPGYVDTPLITIDGSNAGAGVDGLRLSHMTKVHGVRMQEFAAHGLRVLPDLFANGFDGQATDVVDRPFFHPGVTASESVDHGGDGVRVDPATFLELVDVTAARNLGTGVRVLGGLRATMLAAVENADHGILVETDAAVTLFDTTLSGNGHHPDGDTPARSGLHVLRAAATFAAGPVNNQVEPPRPIQDGLWFERGTIAGNSGHGVVLGDAVQQSGRVAAFILDAFIHDNENGIRVQQLDADQHNTRSNLSFNDIHDNRAAGLHLRSSYPLVERDYVGGLGAFFEKTHQQSYVGNSLHHNAVTPAETCSPADATQVEAQVVFDGPVVAEPERAAACQAPGIDTQLECLRLADSQDVLSGGVARHCVWTGIACTVAWPFAAESNVGGCSTAANRVYAYVNDPLLPAATQKGVTAINGAYVRARRNTWGAGGASDGVFAGVGSQVDDDDACGTISTCP